MIVFRLSKKKFSSDLSGKGAEKSGARWNSKGVAMLYASSSRALCTTEIAVHTPLGNVPTDYQLTSIKFPDNIVITELNTARLSPDWRKFPYSNATQQLGDKFISDNRFLVMKAPSAIVQDEYNFLFNPNHKDFHKIKIIKTEAFTFDRRLFVRWK